MLKKLNTKLTAASVGALVALSNAAPTDQLDSLNTTLTTISTKAGTISEGIIGICTIGVVMVIVIAWLKKGKKAS